MIPDLLYVHFDETGQLDLRGIGYVAENFRVFICSFVEYHVGKYILEIIDDYFFPSFGTQKFAELLQNNKGNVISLVLDEARNQIFL